MEVVLVPYKKIDKKKWDDCIQAATNGTLYALSFYLDTLSSEWHALVFDDYKIVMPLIYKSKYGIKYLYQPGFLPQTGIFSRQEITEDITEIFLRKAFRLYRFAEIALAYPAKISFSHLHLTVSYHNNYVIDLSKDHKDIAADYHPHFKKSLRRLQKLSLSYAAGENLKEVAILYFKLYGKKIKNIKPAANKFFALCRIMQKDNDAIIRNVTNIKGELLAAALILRFKGRLYNMISCITPMGKKAEANYFLYDKIIEEFAGKEKILDMEGSDIPGVAGFYLKLNPENEKYPFIKYNNLPGVLKILKK